MTNIGIYYNIEFKQYITNISYENKQILGKMNKDNKNKSLTLTEADKEYISNLIKIKENDKIGKLFEENIRKTMELEFGWKVSGIPRFFFFRRFQVDDSVDILYSGYRINYTQNNKKLLTFELDEDTKACIITNHKTSKAQSFYRNNDNIKYTELNKTFIISPVERIEVDGIYDVNHFSLPKFESNEVSIIYNNIGGFTDNQSVTAILEIKLSKGKLPQLIQQIKRDNEIMQKVVENEIIFIGFVGKGEKDESNKRGLQLSSEVKQNIKNIRCIIYEIRQDKIFQRDLRQYIDWRTVIDLKKVNQKIDSLISSFNDRIDRLEMKLDKILKKDAPNSYLGKKRNFENEKK